MTKGGDWSRRSAHLARAWALCRGAGAQERLGPDDLHALQRQRLQRLVRWAKEASPFYRDLYVGIDARNVGLQDLPPVTKALLMEHFDAVVTDPRLRMVGVRRHLSDSDGQQLHLGEYRVLATSGTTGEPTLCLYSRAEWVVAVAGLLRANDLAGLRPRLPRCRIASLGSTSPAHVSARLGRALDVGLHRLLRLDVRRPFEELLGDLQIFQPGLLIGYAAAIALLAWAQQDGRLAIRPEMVATTGEVRTAEAEEAIVSAWGTRPHSLYGITEGGILGADCRHRRGMHLFEDRFCIENVDHLGNPVPDGEVGSALLLTNLFNRTQPLIRLRLDDMAVIDSSPCPCGRRLRRVVTLEGRSGEILRLRGAGGREVPVHPGAVRRPFATMPDVRQYQLVQERPGLRVRIVPAPASSASATADAVQRALAAVLEDVGAQPQPIRVEVVSWIARSRSHGAKLRLIDDAAVVDAASAQEP